MGLGYCRLIYLTLPGQVVLVMATFVEWDQEVGAGVSVREWKASLGHLFSGRYCP